MTLLMHRAQAGSLEPQKHIIEKLFLAEKPANTGWNICTARAGGECGVPSPLHRVPVVQQNPKASSPQGGNPTPVFC